MIKEKLKSVRVKLFLVLCVVTILLVICLIAINSLVLENFYIYNKILSLLLQQLLPE